MGEVSEGDEWELSKGGEVESRLVEGRDAGEMGD